MSHVNFRNATLLRNAGGGQIWLDGREVVEREEGLVPGVVAAHDPVMAVSVGVVGRNVHLDFWQIFPESQARTVLILGQTKKRTRS